MSYRNVQDSMLLTASLALPRGDGPHPAVVLLSVAGTQRLVDRLVDDGWAVMTPVRRGFVAVEPLLQATYAELAGDALAALSYLGSRNEVDGRALGLVAQADDTQPAMLAAAAAEQSVPLVLLAPPDRSGVETFRREQRWLAEMAGAGPAELAALDRYVGEIVDIVLSGSVPRVREYRLAGLRSDTPVQLPRNAAFPADERQAHYFASPLWHDRLSFEPVVALARLRSPVLVLIGADDPNTSVEAYLATVERGLAAASTRDATVCLLPGRTRHAFTESGVRAITEWLAGRVGAAGREGVSSAVGRAGVEAPDRAGGPAASPPAGCLEDPGR